MSEAQSLSPRLIRIQGYSAELTDDCGILVSSGTSSRRSRTRTTVRALFPPAETLAWAFHNLEGLLPICAPVDAWFPSHLLTETPPERGTLNQEASMGEVVRFVSKAERERLRLIREARAMYDSVFPPSIAQRENTTIAQTVNGPDVRHGENSLP